MLHLFSQPFVVFALHYKHQPATRYGQFRQHAFPIQRAHTDATAKET